MKIIGEKSFYHVGVKLVIVSDGIETISDCAKEFIIVTAPGAYVESDARSYGLCGQP